MTDWLGENKNYEIYKSVVAEKFSRSNILI